MLSVQSQLAALFSDVNEFLDRVRERAPVEELELRKGVVAQKLESIQTTLGEPCVSISSAARHIHWLLYWYRRDKHDGYESDVTDLYRNDLPGIAAAVDSWLALRTDSRLLSAIAATWATQNYAGAIREAFIVLEAELRAAAGLAARHGLSGDKLVAKSFAEPSFTEKVQEDSPLGRLTSGELAGLQHLVRGAFLLYRNAISHRQISFSEPEAAEILGIVNQILRFIPVS